MMDSNSMDSLCMNLNLFLDSTREVPILKKICSLVFMGTEI